MFFLSSCNNVDKSSFQQLSNAFDKWFLSHNPSLSSSQNPKSFYVNNKIVDNKYIGESILDLKRFKLELNQINSMNLNKKYIYKFDAILKQIENQLYNYEIINPYQNDPLVFIDRTKENLLNILSDNNLSKINKSQYLLSFLDYLPIYLDKSKKQLLYADEYSINKSKISIEELINLLDVSINFMNVGIDLELINKKINKNKEILKNYNIWLNEKTSKISFEPTDNEKNIYNDYIKKNESEYNNFNMFESLESSISNLHNNIFMLSLPIYLQTNDEPIWVDKDDTLEVINYVINKRIKGSTPKDVGSKMIEFDSKYNIIKSFLDSLNIDLINDTNIYSFPQESFLFDFQSDKIEISTSFNSRNMYIFLPADDRYIYNSKYSLFIANHVLPRIFYKNSNKGKVIYENKNISYAWGKLLSNIMIENGFSLYDDNFELYHNIELLRDFVDILLKDSILNKKLSKVDLIDSLQSLSFYTEEQAKAHVNDLRFSNSNSIEKYLHYIYMNNLYDLNCLINKRKSNTKFIKLLFENGFIPIHNYNSILN